MRITSQKTARSLEGLLEGQPKSIGFIRNDNQDKCLIQNKMQNIKE